MSYRIVRSRLLGAAGLSIATGCVDFEASASGGEPVGATDTVTGSTSASSSPPSASTGPVPAGTGSGGTGSGGTGSGADARTTGEPVGPPIKLDVSGMPDATNGACSVVSVQAEPVAVPSDIIIVVDNSNSMEQEAQAVRDNLNAFSQQIVDAGVDARVVLITAGPGAFAGICIEPPLGGGGCPDADDNEPLFLHVDQFVSSVDALDRVIDDYPLYQGVLRPWAVKQLLVVSDDNSWLTPMAFEEQFLALDVSHFGYTQHCIVSAMDCPEAAVIGHVYIDLAASTGGTIGDLCLQDFQPVFDELAGAIVENAIPCFYPLPELSGLHDTQTARVTIDIGAGVEPIPGVESQAECGEHDAWFFDDPAAPTAIIFCPTTCLRLKGASEADVEIGVSCGAGF